MIVRGLIGVLIAIAALVLSAVYPTFAFSLDWLSALAYAWIVIVPCSKAGRKEAITTLRCYLFGHKMKWRDEGSANIGAPCKCVRCGYEVPPVCGVTSRPPQRTLAMCRHARSAAKTDMNTRDALTQLAADKRTLESKIRDLIAKEVAGFQMVTGASVTAVDVRMLAQSFVGVPSDYIVSGVAINLALL